MGCPPLLPISSVVGLLGVVPADPRSLTRILRDQAPSFKSCTISRSRLGPIRTAADRPGRRPRRSNRGRTQKEVIDATLFEDGRPIE